MMCLVDVCTAEVWVVVRKDVPLVSLLLLHMVRGLSLGHTACTVPQAYYVFWLIHFLFWLISGIKLLFNRARTVAFCWYELYVEIWLCLMTSLTLLWLLLLLLVLILIIIISFSGSLLSLET